MHDDAGTRSFRRWTEQADTDATEARRHAASGHHHLACDLARQATRYALRAMVEGLCECGSHHDHDLWELAVRTAVEELVGDEFATMLGRVSSRCSKDEAAEPHDARDVDAALADLATARAFAGAAWSTFTQALEGLKSEGGRLVIPTSAVPIDDADVRDRRDADQR